MWIWWPVPVVEGPLSVVSDVWVVTLPPVAGN